MLATEKFSLRISPEERVVFAKLAKLVRRSQSDTIRWVMRETLKALESDETFKQKPKKPSNQKPN